MSWNTISAAALWLCWGLFGVVWLVGAAYNARKGPRTRTRSRIRYAWIPIGLAAWLIIDYVPGGSWPGTAAWWIRLPGLLILLAGTAFTLWARGVLGTMWSAAVVVREAHTLNTTGPYAIVRHPIYTGLLSMLLGTGLMAGFAGWIVVLLGAALLLYLKSRSEERLLTRTFGVEYERYRRKVPQLVPGLRKARS